jgi:hypothetical protein
MPGGSLSLGHSKIKNRGFSESGTFKEPEPEVLSNLKNRTAHWLQHEHAVKTITLCSRTGKVFE